jgi:hypothetical protein
MAYFKKNEPIKTKKILINENIYEFSEGIVNATVQIAKERLTERNVNAIYAIVKEDLTERRDDIFENKESMFERIEQLETLGFKVSFVEAK